MSHTAIRAEELGKQYRIGVTRERYQTLRDTLADAFVSPFRRARKLLRGEVTGAAELDTKMWALKGLSFEINQGEVVGIIGPNGAGKSTLLKILSRITEPTEGDAWVDGRVGALLEVAAGFHPELTGRENTYLYGAILGMRRAEIERKFDLIVAFAGVEKFIDTPVKHYSSGMYVRLAFAVAAHLEPDILLVDEVLAVGDAEFQKKCLGRMEAVTDQGRTILFVSHNMVAVESLCQRVLWLQGGQLIEDGKPSQVIRHYLQSVSSSVDERVWEEIETAPSNDLIRLHRVRVRLANGSQEDQIKVHTPFVIEIEYWNLVPDAKLHVTLHLLNESGIFVLETGSSFERNWHGRPFPVGRFRSVCHVPGNLLNDGGYSVHVLLVKDGGSVIYMHKEALSFEIMDASEARGGPWYGKIQGIVRPRLDWTTEYRDSQVEVKSHDEVRKHASISD